MTINLLGAHILMKISVTMTIDEHLIHILVQMAITISIDLLKFHVLVLLTMPFFIDLVWLHTFSSLLSIHGVYLKRIDNSPLFISTTQNTLRRHIRNQTSCVFF